MKKGYWLKDDKIFDIPNTHIRFLIKHSKLFNISKKFIKQIYKSFDEPLYTEGKARHTLLEKAFRGGWIRAREGRNYWIIELDKICDERMEIINNFIKYAFQGKVIFNDSIINVFDLDTGFIISKVENGVLKIFRERK